jgi:hypothetical protein
MRARIVTKVIGAAAGALIIELADLALDKAGITEEKSRITRAILKAGVAAAGGALLGVLLDAGDEEETQ